MSNAAATRILVLSSSLDQARYFVQRIKDLSDSWAGIAPSNAPLSSSSDVEHASTDSKGLVATSIGGSESIPWTIVNRYYTADVHFETRTLAGVRRLHVEGVPAVVYVFNGSEKYRDQISDLAKTIEVHSDDIEVSLAIRFSHIPTSSSDAAVVTKATVDEEEGLDEFLSGHNFEYIDGDRSGRRPTADGGGFDDEDASGVPGLPRVIDALSTIMWPSIVQSDATRNRKSRARELLDWAREEEEEDGLKALVSPPFDHDDHTDESSQSTLQASSQKKSRMQREMEELERWLEDEDHKAKARKQEEDKEAWRHSDWVDMPTTPTIRSSHEGELGFEDDFTDFIGAPLEVHYAGSQTSSRPDRLIPTHTGASYQSLASFDGSFPIPPGHLDSGDHEDDDDDLPGREEIEAASRRIFGTLPSPSHATLQVPSAPQSSRNLDSPAVFPTSLSHSPASHSHDIPFDTPDSSFALDEDEDEEYEMGAFDLSRVLSALQGMKEEIAGMSDEGERRKAAAKVALGLVYGLKKEEERDAGRGSGSTGAE